jgi:L-methionine (R)-S-oxide reductase
MVNPLIKLQELSNFLESCNLEDNLMQLAEMTASTLNARNCSIMLLTDGDPENPRMRVSASHGPLPDVAYKESIGKGDGISGCVLASGQSILIEDISQSEFANRARRADDPHKSLMSSPITVNRSIVGVVNVSGHMREDPFNHADLTLLEVAALYIGKSIQATQLQNILNSRFAQMALLQEVGKNLDGSMGTVLQNPDQVAKILAKSFYREMTRTGLGPAQIIHAASEIIDQLRGNLKRHNKRIARESPESADKAYLTDSVTQEKNS